MNESEDGKNWDGRAGESLELMMREARKRKIYEYDETDGEDERAVDLGDGSRGTKFGIVGQSAEANPGRHGRVVQRDTNENF